MTRPGLIVASCFVLACGGGSDADPDAPAPDAMVDATPPCEAPTGAGTEHATYVTDDETWSEADSPHIITADLAVQAGATLTIDSCAVVRVRDGLTISVGLGDTVGTLAAQGTPGRPVTFQADTAGATWGSLRVFAMGQLDLEHVVIEGGAIVAQGGGGGELNRHVHAVDVRVSGSPAVGVDLSGKSAFSEGSRDLTVTGAGNRPIAIAPPAVQSVPTGTYTGNAADEILVAPDAIAVDETFHARGVPYRLASTFTMVPTLSEAEGGLATLTIEAGVTITVPRAGGADNAVQLGTSNGIGPSATWPVRLIADGTAAPITFTSGELAPAAGDWAGIEWGGGPATGNVVRNLHVEYAGGDSGTQGFGCGPIDNDAALIIRNWIPEAGSITGSTFRASAAGGIVSGWMTDAGGPDLKTGNTFTDVATCEVSRWKNVTAPACPSGGVTPDCL